ncbi:hypothetical protein CC80DRAFT_432790, partial [Byssothecium circinans]
MNAQPPAPVKDCWNSCDYPSECRWGKRFGVHSPIATAFPTLQLQPPPPPPPTAPSPTANPPASTTFEGILKSENCKEVKKEKKADKTDFWGALVASATRRKSHPPSSPLASVSEEIESSDLSTVLQDSDGDVVMTSFDDVLGAPQTTTDTTPAPATSSPMSLGRTTSTVVSLKEFMRKSSQRVTKSSKTGDRKDNVVTVPAEYHTIGDFDFGSNVKKKDIEDAT